MAEEDRVERKTTRTAPPATPPPIISQVQNDNRSQWARLAGYAAVALIVVGLVVLGGRWIYNSNKDETPKKPAPVAKKPQPRPAASTKKKTTQPSSENRTGSSTGSQSDRSGNTGEELANTGPGEVVALFAGVTLAAAGLHYIVSLRRAS